MNGIFCPAVVLLLWKECRTRNKNANLIGKENYEVLLTPQHIFCLWGYGLKPLKPIYLTLEIDVLVEQVKMTCVT